MQVDYDDDDDDDDRNRFSTTLMTAVQNGDTKTVTDLLKTEQSILQEDKNGRTVLWYACSKDSFQNGKILDVLLSTHPADCVKILIRDAERLYETNEEYDKDFFIRDIYWKPPASTLFESLRVFIKSSVTPSSSVFSTLIYFIAEQFRQKPEARQWLLDAPHPIEHRNLLSQAVDESALEAVKLILLARPVVRHHDLCDAANDKINGHLILKELLRAVGDRSEQMQMLNMNTNSPYLDTNKWPASTVLMCAAWMGSEETVRMLVDEYDAPAIEDLDDRWCALSLALDNGQPTGVVEVLLGSLSKKKLGPVHSIIALSTGLQVEDRHGPMAPRVVSMLVDVALSDLRNEDVKHVWGHQAMVPMSQFDGDDKMRSLLFELVGRASTPADVVFKLLAVLGENMLIGAPALVQCLQLAHGVRTLRG